jgi:hypothetical protein
MTTYTAVRQFPSNAYAIVMTDDEGHRSLIEDGIKTQDRAEKRADMWRKREAAARKSAA